MMRALYGPSPSVGTTSKFGGNAQSGEKNTNTIVGWNHTFSPTLISDVTLSYLHLPIYRTPQNYKTDFSSIIPGLGTPAHRRSSHTRHKEHYISK